LESRVSDHWALLRWAAIVVAPQYLVIGAWDEMIDPGALESTWPIRVALAVFFGVFAAVIWRARSIPGHVIAWWVGYAVSAVGFGLIVSRLEGGFVAGVGAFVVPVGLVALSLTHIQALVGLGILLGAPAAIYGAAGATTVELVNLLVWLMTGAAFAYVAFRMTDRTRRRAFIAERSLAVERDRSESLLRNVLPEPVAERLKARSETIAERFESISILFVDIVGFTPLSQQLEATEVVDMLNSLFSHFDLLVDRFGVEKMRTIGDSYMAVAGVPTPVPDHAAVMADIALEIRDHVRSLGPTGSRPIDVRIGINSGPVIAGVIGTRRFQYDVWGDAVNTASRMESHGVPGKIQITEATLRLIEDRFECVPRGTIEVKGKGPMDTWFVEGRL
jgi:class 3 adenylate cyclase